MGWYFPILGTGFAIGILVGAYNAEKQNVSFHETRNFVLMTLLSAIIGARAFHVFFEGGFWYYLDHPFEAVQPWIGGLSVLGGLIGVFLGAYFLYRKKRQTLLTLLDTFAPSFLIGLAIARIGCFVQGCCYGKVTTLPWGIIYEKGQNAYRSQLEAGLIDGHAHEALPVHPTQLYTTLAAFLLFLFIQFGVFPKNKMRGQVALLTMMLYSLMRFTIEFFRADHRGMVTYWLSVPQMAALMGVVISSILLWKLRRVLK